MIVSLWIKDALKDLTLTYKEFKLDNTEKGNVNKNVLFSFGTQEDLNKFIANRSNLENFPLVWYVKPNFARNTEILETFRVKGKFVLMTGTRADMYNEERALQNFANILYPLADLVFNTLKKQRNISITSQQTNEYNENSFGLDVYNSSIGSKSKSQTLVYTDAWVLEFDFNIKKPCNNG